MNAEELAHRVTVDGFVTLPLATYGFSPSVVEKVRCQVLNQFEMFLAEASAQKLDLTLDENAERLPGFYVREGGRIDMQLYISDFTKTPSPAQTLQSVDIKFLQNTATAWQSVLQELFCQANFHLDYIGCVISRPGDSEQNWHLDGVHYNRHIQEPVDRLNVFVPLVAITDQVGGTEMKIRSHIHDNGARGPAFKDYQDLPSVIACVGAGTPLLMDYRVWHRGLGNLSKSTIRPLLYFKYVKASAVTQVLKERKRITPTII